MILCGLWSDRNRVIHGGLPKRSELILETVLNFLSSFQQRKGLHRSSSFSPMRTIRWDPPELGSFKLITDASVRCGDGWVGLGGVIRDSNGSVLACFSKKSHGSLSVENSKPMAIREGLFFAAQNNLHVSMWSVMLPRWLRA
ncbi:hypothetical protein TorRG33x02_298020 [Trema orientale]|uniref:RNase H type-1 domain-containing protein n=1 Tax=Trema orientale TaxID=63057 RepID=A0A2P5C4F8_TREOI|nr:hypothetical protein TorRG33x02_298020 [Trema orientale]